MASKLSGEALTWGSSRGPASVLTTIAAMYTRLRARLGGLRVREEGVTAVEYAFIVAIIAVLLVGAVYTMYDSVRMTYSSVADCLASGPVPDSCAPAPPPDPGGG
jgi:Flp pilus assembly pilin Flp